MDVKVIVELGRYGFIIVLDFYNCVGLSFLVL